MPRAGILHSGRQESLRKPETANHKPFSWGSKGAILFCEREWPLCPCRPQAAYPSAPCAESSAPLCGAQKKSCPFGQLFSNLCSLFGDEGEQSDLTGALDGLGQLTLMHRRRYRWFCGAGSCRTLGDEAAQLGGVLIVDILALVNAELAHLSALAGSGRRREGPLFSRSIAMDDSSLSESGAGFVVPHRRSRQLARPLQVRRSRGRSQAAA